MIPASDTVVSPLLSVTALAKGYRMGAESLDVLSGVELNVARGEMVVIMGPSGSGKTTLLNCLSGVDEPDGGEVLLDGEAIDFGSSAVRTRLRRNRVGMVFQFFNLIPTLTVRENVLLPFLIAGRPGSAEQERVDHLLDEVGMHKRAGHYPFQLSGGEMQLTSIARALARRPGLLLADEPTGNVNPHAAECIMGILTRTAEAEGAGVLMVTHSPEHAAWADRVCFLKDGRIAVDYQQGRRSDDPAGIHAKLLELGI